MKTITDYKDSSQLFIEEEEFCGLANARLVFADPLRFISDFGIQGMSQSLIAEAEAWMVSVGGVLSPQHANANSLDVHDRPNFLDRIHIGYRPPRYGRSALFELQSTGPAHLSGGLFKGLVDVKGCGSGVGESLTPHPMRNGILFLHDALIELINYKLLNRLFDRDGVNLSTVPFYGILHTGVRAKASWAGNRLPCATLIRKALVRQPGHIDLPFSGSVEEEIQFAVESYLLSRGLTTVGPITTVCIMREEERYVLRLDGEPVKGATEEMIIYYLDKYGLYPPQILHFVNVQIARSASLDPLRACLVDLGHVRACDELPGHLGVFVRDRQLNWGKVVRKGQSGWPRRNPELGINHGVFGPQIMFKKGLDQRLYDWLRPTNMFKTAGSGLLHEALRLAMIVDQERCGPGELMAEVENFVDRSLSTA